MNHLSEEFELDDLIAQLIIYTKIENGLKDIINGNLISESDLGNLLKHGNYQLVRTEKV